MEISELLLQVSKLLFEFDMYIIAISATMPKFLETIIGVILAIKNFDRIFGDVWCFLASNIALVLYIIDPSDFIGSFWDIMGIWRGIWQMFRRAGNFIIRHNLRM